MLELTLCGKGLKSPLILGSGTLGERKEPLIKALEYGAGAVVSRSLRTNPSKRKIFKPAYYINEKYMLNADNQNITPWTYWLENAEEIERHGPLIISLSARDAESCKTIVSEFEKKHKPSFYELNFSCSHSAKIYGQISYGHVEKVLKEIKKITSCPVFLKLSLDNIDIEKILEIEKKSLADAFVLSNTIGPGLKIDIKTKKPVLESAFGGLSGPAIKPLVLAAIYEMRKKIKKPIIGVGGIETAEDVIEFLIVGCDAVQIYTKAHKEGVTVFNEINNNLKVWLKENKETLESIKGSIKEW